MLKPDHHKALTPGPVHDCHPDMVLFYAAGNDRRTCPCPGGCGGLARWSAEVEWAKDRIVTRCPNCGMYSRGRHDEAWTPYLG